MKIVCFVLFKARPRAFLSPSCFVFQQENSSHNPFFQLLGKLLHP